MMVARVLPIRGVALLVAAMPAFAIGATGAVGASLVGCELDTQPPVAPQNGSTDVAPPAPPPQPPPGAQAAQGPDAPAANDPQYASGEVAVGENTDAYDDDDPAALTDFHGALDPYGSWVDDGTYGTVWVPSQATVGADFTPYTTAGHWTYDDDWVWVSDYPWGWAPFHYGRWAVVEGRGWAWIPGRVYRGAWVGWSVDDGYGYVGWAPLGPEFVWFGGRAVAWHTYIGPRWVYCARGAVFAPGVGGRVLVGPAAARFSGNMHAFVSANPGVAGPAPGRLGYSPAQVPRPTGAGAQSITRAQAFARPSTAQPVGGSAPAHFAAASARPSPVGARPAVADSQRAGSIATARGPSTMQPQGARPAAGVNTATPRAAPAVRAAPAARPSMPGHSGGHHR